MRQQEMIVNSCSKLQILCERLSMHYYFVGQRRELGGSTDETMAIIAEILDGINRDTVQLRELLDVRIAEDC